jgi:DNA-directed RNA polymerase subunit K/omega
MEVTYVSHTFEVVEEKGRKSARHKTSPYMTKYEYTRLIAQRAIQLSKGVDYPRIDATGMYDPKEIAIRELHERVLPYIILRKLPDGTEESWDPKDMHIRNF